MHSGSRLKTISSNIEGPDEGDRVATKLFEDSISLADISFKATVSYCEARVRTTRVSRRRYQ